MKNKFSNIIIWGLLIVVAILLFRYFSKVEVPKTELNGDVIGKYSIESILTLDKPYQCVFEKEDGVSKITANIFTNEKDIYADFAIQTNAGETGRFNSFFLIKDGSTYGWTSLSNLGYKTGVVKSASINATPLEQAQIIGIKDKLDYKCKLLSQADVSLFIVPSSINFNEF